jgi:hypothetical protein
MSQLCRRRCSAYVEDVGWRALQSDVAMLHVQGGRMASTKVEDVEFVLAKLAKTPMCESCSGTGYFKFLGETCLTCMGTRFELTRSARKLLQREYERKVKEYGYRDGGRRGPMPSSEEWVYQG